MGREIAGQPVQGPVKIGPGRWGQVVAGGGLLLFLGLIYAWSIFVPQLQAEFDWSRAQLSMAFTICMAMFCIGGFVAGLLSKRFSTGMLLRVCAVLVLMGFGIASRVHSLAGIYICYGCFVGFGVGIAYNTLISTVTKWFPDRTGFVSGVMLMGFGMGGMVLGTVCTALMEAIGWRSTFLGIAVVYAALVLVCSFLIKAPPTGYAEGIAANAQFPAGPQKKSAAVQGKNFTTKGMLSTASFWLFFIWATVLTSAGLALIGHASPAAMDMGATVGAAAFYAGLISLCNGLGRMISGVVFDKIGRLRTMAIVSAGFILSGVILMLAQRSGSVPLLVVGYVATGLSYGGVMPCNSTVVSQFYGREHYAMNFSMINMNILIASPLGPMLAATLQGGSGNYFTTFIAISAFGVCALLLNFFIKQPSQK